VELSTLNGLGFPLTAKWYCRRFAERGWTLPKVGVIALARKLAVALWRFLEPGLMPKGAND
jgi:transposase